MKLDGEDKLNILTKLKLIFLAKKTYGEIEEAIQMDTKSWYKSVTMWSSIIVGISTALQLTGIANVQDILTQEKSTEIAQQLVNILTAGGNVAGVIGAIYGRTRAKTVMTK